MTTRELMQASIFWKRHVGHGRYFLFQDDDGIAVLRLNNFPEEVLFTLINGSEIIDIEDQPPGWILDDEDVLGFEEG